MKLELHIDDKDGTVWLFNTRGRYADVKEDFSDIQEKIAVMFRGEARLLISKANKLTPDLLYEVTLKRN